MSDKSIQLSSSSGTLNIFKPSAFKTNILGDLQYPAFNGTFLDPVSINEETRIIKRKVDELVNPPSPASLTPISTQKSLEEHLFDATANVKILTSQVAMHLERAWRDKLFRQLDSLHDLDEWEQNDEPIQKDSFACFLKAIFQIKPQRRPGLGLSSMGNLIASWTTDLDRLTVEFLPGDRVRWVITQQCNCESEYFSGQTAVSRLADGLAPYQPEKWFKI